MWGYIEKEVEKGELGKVSLEASLSDNFYIVSSDIPKYPAKLIANQNFAENLSEREVEAYITHDAFIFSRGLCSWFILYQF